MTALWIILGGVAGGTAGWLMSRFNKRAEADSCEPAPVTT